MANGYGNISTLLICTRVGNSLQLMDVNTLNYAEVTSNVYWRVPFPPLASAKAMTEYTVLDVEPLGTSRGRYELADVHVARTTDFMSNDVQYITRSHLGNVLNPGDTVLGYDLTHANFNNDEFDKLDRRSLPDVILVRKTYPVRRKKNKQRQWKLQQLGKEVDDMLPRKQDQAKIENDMEMFMRDIEEDPEFRSTINVFKNQGQPSAAQPSGDAMMESDIEEEDFPEISLEEMLDEMQINMDGPDQPHSAAADGDVEMA